MEPSAHQELLRLASPGLCYTKTDITHAKKLAVMGKEFLEAAVLKFLRDHAQEVQAISYQSDATPQVVLETFTDTDGPRRRLNRSRRTGEFVLERLFAITASGARSVLLQWPARIADKTTWTHVTLAANTIKFPFQYGCDAVNVVHVCFDGALFTSLADLLHRHNARCLHDAAQAADEGEGALLTLRSWFVATPCMNHAAHCSARWPLKDLIEDDHLMKDLWSIIEASRSARASVMDHAPGWVASRLVFRDWGHEHLYRFWTMLGIESVDCDELSDLQVRVVDGTIYVAEHLQDDPEIVNRLVLLLQRMICWRPWTDSRWLSIGDSTRTFLAALSLGWASLVEYARTQGHSTYHIQNFEKLRADIVGFAVKAAVSTFVSDAALGALLSDDRLPMTLGKIEDDIACELDYIATLAQEVWEYLGQLSHHSPHQLRSEAYGGALASAAFLRGEILGCQTTSLDTLRQTSRSLGCSSCW